MMISEDVVEYRRTYMDIYSMMLLHEPITGPSRFNIWWDTKYLYIKIKNLWLDLPFKVIRGYGGRRIP